MMGQVIPGLPRDVMNIIVSKMDIETRIALKIFSRFKETPEFKAFKKRLNDTLSNVRLKETSLDNEHFVGLSIGPNRSLLPEGYTDSNGLYYEPMYGIYREISNGTLVNYYIIHAPKENDLYNGCLGAYDMFPHIDA